MGLQYRAIRAAASALLVAAAVGTGGMAGMTSALAAEPTTVTVGGTLVDESGDALGGIQLKIIEELAPDGGLAGFPVTTAADGSFSAELYPWGTAEAPVEVTVETEVGQLREIEHESCAQTWGVLALDHRQLALAEAAPEPLIVTATTTLLGEVCGTTATPPPNGANGGGRPALTPPPTDVVPAPLQPGSSDRHGPALSIGFVLGLLLAGLLLLRRPRARRRD